MSCVVVRMTLQFQYPSRQLGERFLCRLLTASLEIVAAGVMSDDGTGGSCINSSSLNIRTERLVI